MLPTYISPSNIHVYRLNMTSPSSVTYLYPNKTQCRTGNRRPNLTICPIFRLNAVPARGKYSVPSRFLKRENLSDPLRLTRLCALSKENSSLAALCSLC